jgi:hypothetical protein
MWKFMFESTAIAQSIFQVCDRVYKTNVPDVKNYAIASSLFQQLDKIKKERSRLFNSLTSIA